MAKFKINTVRDSGTVRKFTFRIRDFYEKYTFEATTKAKDVLEAKQKIKEKLIGWGNMMIMNVTDDTGHQYFGRQLITFKDENTTEKISDAKFAIQHKAKGTYLSKYNDLVSEEYALRFNTEQEAKNKINNLQNDWEDSYNIVKISDTMCTCDHPESECGPECACGCKDEYVKDMSYERNDAIDRCYNLGKQFVEHFNKIYANPSDVNVNHWCNEMQSWYDKVRQITLKDDKKPLSKDKLVDWFFTLGSNPDIILDNATQDKISAYNDFTYKLLLSNSVKNSLHDIIKIQDSSKLMDGVEVSHDNIREQPIYVLQSDVDKNLYAYIGKTHMMKEGEWSYTQYKLNGVSPETVKSQMLASGWHQVQRGPAPFIDSCSVKDKIYAPIVDAKPKYTFLVKSYKGNKQIDANSELEAVGIYKKMYPDVPNEDITAQLVKRIDKDDYTSKLISENRDNKIKDGWSGTRNGIIYSYNNGKWSITHKNGKVETFPDEKFNSDKELYAYIDTIKDEQVPIDEILNESENIAKQGIVAELNTTNDYQAWVNALKEMYNKTQDEKYLKAAEAVADINREEKVHVGEFSQVLANLNPENGEAVQEGMEEVREEDSAVIHDGDYYVQIDMVDEYGGVHSIIVKANNLEEAKNKAAKKYPKWKYRNSWGAGKNDFESAKYYNRLWIDSSIKDAEPTKEQIEQYAKSTGLSYVDAKRALEEDVDFHEIMQHYQYDKNTIKDDMKNPIGYMPVGRLYPGSDLQKSRELLKQRGIVYDTIKTKTWKNVGQTQYIWEFYNNGKLVAKNAYGELSFGPGLRDSAVKDSAYDSDFYSMLEYVFNNTIDEGEYTINKLVEKVYGNLRAYGRAYDKDLIESYIYSNEGSLANKYNVVIKDKNLVAGDVVEETSESKTTKEIQEPKPIKDKIKI